MVKRDRCPVGVHFHQTASEVKKYFLFNDVYVRGTRLL